MSQRSAAAIPLLLLVVSVAAHAVLVETADISPWRGNGFSMFAYVDGSDRGFTFDSGSGAVRVPPTGDVVRASWAPTDAAINGVVADRGYADGLLVLWRPSFAPNSDELSWEVVLSRVVP